MTGFKSLIRSPQVIACVFIWVLSFLLYAISAPTGPSGVADADEFLSVALAGGVAHSPGYPLYTSLLELFLKLPVPTKPPFKTALLSGSLQATTGVFIFLIAQVVFKQLSKKTKAQTQGRNYEVVLLVLGTLLAQTNLLVWQYALLSEVFALTNFFFAVCTFLWLKATFSLQKKHVLLAAFAWGLGIAHHYLLLGLAPLALSLVISQWLKRKGKAQLIKTWGLMLTSLFMGIGISQALLWWRLSRHALISWVFAPTLQGWWHFVSRGLYSGVLADGSQAQGLLSPVVLSDAAMSVITYITANPVSLLLVFASFSWVMRKRRALWVYGLLSTTLLMTVGIAILLAVPKSINELQKLELLTLVERMHLPGYALMGIWMSVGLALLGTRASVMPSLSRNLSLSKRSRVRVGTALSLGLATLFFNIHSGFSVLLPLKSGYPAPQAIKQQLEKLPQNSVMLCFSDLTCFTSMYYLGVEKVRDDIQLVPVSEQLRFAAGSQHVPVRYPDNPLRLAYVLAEAHAKGLSVFTSQISPLYANIWSIGTVYALDIKPIFKEITCDSKNLPIENPQLIAELVPLPTKLATLNYQRAFITQENNEYHSGLNCPDAYSLAQQALECSDYPCQLQRGLLATMLDPYNSSYRSMLAGLYELQHFTPMAIREYQLAYTLDPGNATAAAALTRLDQSQAYPVDLKGL